MLRIRASLAVVLGLVGFLVLVAVTGQEDVRRDAQSRSSGLVRLIRTRQAEVDDLGARLVDLRAEVLSARRRLSEESGSNARRVDALELRAGTRPMKGAGVVVTLTDSDRETTDPVERAALAVQDVDLQLLVNALWAAGAEAVAVNGQRLVATSPIRGAGETITVNFRPLVPPYRVAAIAVEADVFSRSEVARRFVRFRSDFGFGFSVKSQGEVTVPAYLGTVQLQSARPLSEPSAPVPDDMPTDPPAEGSP